MRVTDEMVEAAARAVEETIAQRHGNSVQVWMTSSRREVARAALEAALAVEGTEAKPVARQTFPILGSGGARIDYHLVADHGKQAQKNHYQSVATLAERGGLSWSELYAVLHDQTWRDMDTNEAMLACRALEAKYLAAVSALRGQS